MFIAMIFGAIVSMSIHSTKVQPDCKARNFEPEACKVSEAYYKAGK